MLWDLALWHGLAKMRIHTEETIQLLEATTRELAVSVASFEHDVCPHFETRKLAKEVARCGQARLCQEQQAAASQPEPTASQPKQKVITNKDVEVASGGARMRVLGVQHTYKWHRLANAARTIRRFGTSDNYSTQSVHCSPSQRFCTDTYFREKWNTRA
jgi:hypothetical protein